MIINLPPYYENDQPPPYSEVILNVTTIEPSIMEIQHLAPLQLPSFIHSLLSSLTTTLGQDCQFTFVQLNKIGLLTNKIMVRINGPYGHPLLHVNYQMGRYKSTGNQGHHVRDEYFGSVMEFLDTSGIIIMRAQETSENAMSVTSGNFLLGFLSAFGIFSSKLTAKNPASENLLRIIPTPNTSADESRKYKIVLEPSDVIIGTFCKTRDESARLTILDNSVGPTIIGLMIVSTFRIFTKLHAQTTMGIGNGESGIFLTKCCGGILVVLIVLIIINLVVLLN